MYLLLSAILLGSFVFGVDMLLSDGDDLATRFEGLFQSPDRLVWPTGVQEGDSGAWRRPASPAGPGDEPDVEPDDAGAWPGPEIIEDGVAPVAVSRVRPH